MKIRVYPHHYPSKIFDHVNACPMCLSCWNDDSTDVYNYPYTAIDMWIVVEDDKENL